MALENGKKSLACLTIQGVQDQIQFQTALSQKLCKLDHTLVKPNCVWKIYIFFSASWAICLPQIFINLWKMRQFSIMPPWSSVWETGLLY